MATAGRFLWFSNLKFKKTFIERMTGLGFLLLLQDAIQRTEDPDKKDVMNERGINGEFKSQNLFFLYTVFYYGYLVSKPPTVTIYVLFDRIFKLLSTFISRTLMKRFNGRRMETLYEQDMAIIRRARSKYPQLK